MGGAKKLSGSLDLRGVLEEILYSQWVHRWTIFSRPEDFELPVEILVELEDGGDVSTPITVVRSGPNSDEAFIREHIVVSLHDKLVRSADELEVVHVVELTRDFLSEKPPCAPRADRPRTTFRVGVAPHQVAEAALMRHLLDPIDEPDLV